MFAQTGRTVQLINNDWNFKFCRTANEPDSDKIINVVNLPHCWGVNEATDDTPGYLRTTASYTKNLYIAKNKSLSELFLFFEGVNQYTEVYVNGHLAGTHTGGYTQFFIDITAFAKTGKNNRVEVFVSNVHNADIPPISADFTFFGGIHRNISLVRTHKIHFDFSHGSSSGLLITPTVSKQRAAVNIKAKITSVEKTVKEIILETQLFTSNDSLVTDSKQSIMLNSTTNIELTQTTEFQHPALWSPNNPYLYTTVVKILDRATGDLLDSIVQKIGFRTYSFDSDKGLILNGERFKLIGANRHQSFQGKGFAMGDELELNDIWLLKKMGANYLRTSHYPQSQSVIDLCDQLGIICSVEVPLVNEICETEQFAQNSLNMTREMVYQNYNHASVFIWAFMNEIFLVQPFKNNPDRNTTYKQNVVKLANRIQTEIKEIDTIRPTMIPCHGDLNLYVESDITKIPEIIGWNLYQGWYIGELGDLDKFLVDAKTKDPDKSIIVSEYGVDTDIRLHTFNPRRFDSTHEYAVKLHQYYLDKILSTDFVAGSAIWNFNDFYSEARTNAIPHVNDKGLLTLNRTPKDTYRFYQVALNKQPTALLASKDWALRAGTLSENQTCIQPVVVFSNTDDVSLSVNNQKIENSQKEKFCYTYDVPFVNGTNKLNVYVGKILVDSQTLKFRAIPQNIVENPAAFHSLSVMLGSERYFYNPANSEIWIPDQEYKPGSWGYIGGDAYEKKGRLYNLPGSDADILQTNIDPVFQTAREGIKYFKIDVPDGMYNVDLFFAELRSNRERAKMANELGNESVLENTGDRNFDVLINNEVCLEDFNLSKTFGVQTAVIKSVTVAVKNHTGIIILFEKKVGRSILNAIRIEKIQ